MTEATKNDLKQSCHKRFEVLKFLSWNRSVAKEELDLCNSMKYTKIMLKKFRMKAEAHANTIGEKIARHNKTP